MHAAWNEMKLPLHIDLNNFIYYFCTEQVVGPGTVIWTCVFRFNGNVAYGMFFFNSSASVQRSYHILKPNIQISVFSVWYFKTCIALFCQ